LKPDITGPAQIPSARGCFFFFAPAAIRSLPTITPELLWFESHTTGAPERAVVLPNGDVAFAHRGAVHAMPEALWRQFLAYQQAAA
jgi:hypothetical protein